MQQPTELAPSGPGAPRPRARSVPAAVTRDRPVARHPRAERALTVARRAVGLVAAGTGGAVLGPYRQLRGIVREVRQAAEDYRAITRLVDGARGRARGGPDGGSRWRDRVGLPGLRLWYLAPFPLYQVADDLLTYPVFLAVEDRLGPAGAYAVTAGVTLLLASVMGLGQRAAERLKAELLGVPTRADPSDLLPPLLDAAVNSAPWQVARKASEPRPPGAPVPLVGAGRVLAFATSYAVVNTGLYVLAASLPANEWVSFVLLLVVVWMLGGAYESVTAVLRGPGGRAGTTPAPDFDASAFVPGAYNRTYYSEVMQDEALLVRWQAGALHDALTAHLAARGLPRFSHHLDAGCGPAVHHLFALEKYAAEIHVADYLDANLEEVRAWVAGSPDAHDWTPFVRAVLQAEGLPDGDVDVRAREHAVRSKITKDLPLDLRQPTDPALRGSAPLVTSFFVACSATSDTDVFLAMTARVLELVAPGGMFVGAYLGGCDRYLVGDRWVRSAGVRREHLVAATAAADLASVEITRVPTPDMAAEGFDHVFTVVATVRGQLPAQRAADQGS